MNPRALLLLVLAAGPAAAQDGWSTSSPDNYLRMALRPSVEITWWAGDHPAPGLVDVPDRSFVAPRLTLEMDVAAGDTVYFHATGRWDRGFDSGNEPDGDLRLDEVFLRLRPAGDERLNIQVGKFPTVFGAWVAQHDFYDDPFLLAPLPYSQVIGVQERIPGALSPAAIAARADGRALPVSLLDKQNWASQLWGPVYACGISVFGSLDHIDYAFEVKNSGLSSHADQWEHDAGDFSAPTFTGRIGYRPDAAWAFGVSASHGSYLAEEAEALLPPGVDRGDLSQTAVGIDARWAHHDWIVSGEVVASQYETLAAGDLRTLSWFLQARWKAAPGFWLAGRFGQMISNDADGPAGRQVSWTADVWRAELAAGWRISPRVLVKADYSFTHSDDDSAGEHLFGMGIGLRW